jgi:hypothetical protein
MSGLFSGKAAQSSLLVTGSQDSITMTNGEFNNIPYVEEVQNFNFGLLEFNADGQKVEMNTASASVETGSVNSDTYDFYNISSGTANAAKSIVIQLDDSRYQEGLTTYFKDEYSGPFDSQVTDSLAFASYWTGLLGGSPKFYDSQDGSITIDKIETVNGEDRVSGVFSFNGEDGTTTISITNGNFEAILR